MRQVERRSEFFLEFPEGNVVVVVDLQVLGGSRTLALQQILAVSVGELFGNRFAGVGHVSDEDNLADKHTVFPLEFYVKESVAGFILRNGSLELIK